MAGELLQAAGSWGIGFGMAPEGLQGQYQGLWSTGFAAANMMGPFVVTTLCIGVGGIGWVVPGVILAVSGVATVPLVAWAERSRPSYALAA